MKNDKDQTFERDEEIVAPKHKGTQGTASLTGRPNIDVITSRNEEEAKQDRKSSYKKAGILALFVVIIVIAIYFFS